MNIETDFEPNEGRVLVKPNKRSDMMGKVYAGHEYKNPKISTGVIVSLGAIPDGTKFDNKVDSQVVYKRFSGIESKMGDDIYEIIPMGDIEGEYNPDDITIEI